MQSGDVARIRKTMDSYTVQLVPNTCKFYASYFTTYPQYFPMFYPLRNIPCDYEKIQRHEWIKEQGPRFVSAVVDLIDNIDNLEALRNSIRQLVGKPRHTKHELMADDYMITLRSFVANMKTCLGDDFDEADSDAWARLLKRVEGTFHSEMTNTTPKPAPKQALSKQYSNPFSAGI